MKVFILSLLMVFQAYADPPTVLVPTPKHVYVSVGHLPNVVHDTDDKIFLVVFICRDKNGNRIMVGVNVNELHDIYSQLNIGYEKIDIGY